MAWPEGQVTERGRPSQDRSDHQQGVIEERDAMTHPARSGAGGAAVSLPFNSELQWKCYAVLFSLNDDGGYMGVLRQELKMNYHVSSSEPWKAPQGENPAFELFYTTSIASSTRVTPCL